MTTQLTGEDKLLVPEPPPNGSSGGLRPDGGPSNGVDAEAGAPTQRDVQRDALRQLVELCTQCAASDSEIRRRRKTEIDSHRKQYDKANVLIEQRYQAHAQAAEARLAASASELEQRSASASAQIKAAEEHGLGRIEAEYDPVMRKIKQKLDHDVWLAESVFEVSQNQVKAELKKANDDNEKYVESLDEMLAYADIALKRYHQSAPQITDQDQKELPPMTAAEVEPLFNSSRENAEKHLKHLRHLAIPGMFSGATPVLIAIVVIAIGAGGGWLLMQNVNGAVAGAGAGLVLVLALGIALWVVAKGQVRDAYQQLADSLATGRHAAGQRVKMIEAAQEQAQAVATEKRKVEINKARQVVEPVKLKAAEKRQNHRAALAAQIAEKRKNHAEERVRNRKSSDDSANRERGDVEHNRDTALLENQSKLEQEDGQTEARYAEARGVLEHKWTDGLVRIQRPMEQTGEDGAALYPAWEDSVWDNWKAPKRFPSGVRFGELQVDLKKVIDGVPKDGEFTLPVPDSFTLPGQLAFPAHASLLIEASDRAGREEAVRTLQMAMIRLLTGLPPGRVHFTILDPVSLGRNFAGFMHLADYDEALIGTRIWTDAEQIERRLTDLTEHMETVIQKYLRNEFATIDEYNAQAGELAEPYRILVVADFPHGFQGDAGKRLNSIASSGARCGVYTLMMRDTRVALPSGMHLDDVESHSVTLVQKPEVPGEPPHFAWKDEVFKQFPLKIDEPPASEEFLTKILNEVGRKAKENKRVEVPFDTIAPKLDQYWSLSTKDELRVPIGRMGATRLQMMRLGKGVAQHALLAGKTGSGKSTLLHAIITNLAMWYKPDEVEFYLVDFKKGVEFKTYANHALPHARVIAVESDREFGLSVLQRLDAELARRGELYRKAGAQDVSSYRSSPGAEVLPRTLLIIDEFQELFSEDDKLAQDSSLLIDRLVRQGRAFGVHVVLGSQTVGGSGGLSRSTLSQMAVRVALMLSEADSQLILGDNNSAARLLSRPGEAIYNDAGGLVENNSPFQIAFLGDVAKDTYLDRVHQMDVKASNGNPRPEPIVFEGNQPADILKNNRLVRLLQAPAWPPASTSPPIGWFGEPVAIKDPTGVVYRRQSGANALLIGQQEEGAIALLAASIIGLAAQLPPSMLTFRIMDGTPADSPLASVLPRVKDALPHQIDMVDYRLAADAMTALGDELKRRQESSEGNPPAIFLVIYGLQRYRILRKTEESFSFGSSDEPKAAAPDKIFVDLIREGPALGIHVMAWTDTPASIERTLDRQAMREFDNRILFQMSANDSSNLIDSPAANKLGQNRALAYSEEQGTIEKFRPYAVPSDDWLARVKSALGSRQQ